MALSPCPSGSRLSPGSRWFCSGEVPPLSFGHFPPVSYVFGRGQPCPLASRLLSPGHHPLSLRLRAPFVLRTFPPRAGATTPLGLPVHPNPSPLPSRERGFWPSQSGICWGRRLCSRGLGCGRGRVRRRRGRSRRGRLGLGLGRRCSRGVRSRRSLVCRSWGWTS